MDKFPTQREATQTARASLIGLLSVPAAAGGKEKPIEKPSLSRRRFFALR
jgi:hypothetical protein